MIDSTSRYASLKTKTLTVPGPDGEPREIRYLERRILPASGGGTTIVEHRVVEGDRLDRLTAKYTGDPLQFWRVADANDAMRPEELTDEIGRRIVIALPRA